MTEPSLTIEGIPTSIKRADYLALIATLGLDVKDLVELQFGWKAITAVVKARNAEGKYYEDPHERNALAKHHITIPVVDHEHNWLDVTAVDYPDHAYLCADCGATKREPR